MKVRYLEWISILALVLLFLTSCSSNPTTPNSSSAPVPVATAPSSKPASPAAEKPSGTLTIADASLAEETFLPWNGGVIRTAYYRGLIYDTLVIKNSKSELVPSLATKWERSADGKMWTITLRQGVNFQGGWGELTSDDVKYSYERMAGPDAVMSISPALRQKVDHIDAPDRYTVIFSLKAPEADFMSLYGWDIGGIVCKKYLQSVGDTAANNKPIGTGPYTLLEHKQGAYIKLETVPDVKSNWRLTPDFQYITFQIVPEEVTRISMLKTGEADMVEMGFESIPALTGNPNVEVRPQCALLPATDVIRFGGLIQPRQGYYDPKNPWADKSVRQALNYAINKEDMATQLYYGFGKPAACESGIAEWMQLPPYPYDPAKAKALLADASILMVLK